MKEKIPFSVIVPLTKRDNSLKSLFKNSDRNSDLIIVENEYNNFRVQNQIPTDMGFRDIVYTPTVDLKTNLPINTTRCLNTGLMLCTTEWIIITDKILEFKENFFSILREDLKVLSDALPNTPFVFTGQTLHESQKAQKWNNYLSGYHSRFHFVPNAEMDFDFICLKRNLVNEVNGIDERYNIGNGFHFNNLLLRLLYRGVKVMLDQYLMVYLHQDDETKHIVNINDLLWNYDKIEIQNGKIVAFNPFRLGQIDSEILRNKIRKEKIERD